MKPDGDIVLITGSNGRIGSAVMRELRKTWSSVLGFDMKAEKRPPCLLDFLLIGSRWRTRRPPRVDPVSRIGPPPVGVTSLNRCKCRIALPSTQKWTAEGAMSVDHSGHGTVAGPAAADKPTKTGGRATYTCPMHPEIRRSEPGSCPICGMTLELAGAASTAKASAMPAMKGEANTEMASHAMPGMQSGALTDEMPDMTGDMMGDAHRAMLRPHYVAIMLGFWMISGPFTLGHLSDFLPDASQVRVMAERGLSPFARRAILMTLNDVGSGILIVIFGYLSASALRKYPWA